jgi:NAD(P)-dependent dehydrogenase (short-subunit alcohol dehydrogenase family)
MENKGSFGRHARLSPHQFVLSTMSTKVSIVTGASRGIGSFIAKALAENYGHHVIITGRQGAKLDALADATDGAVTVAPADLTSENDRNELVQVAQKCCDADDHHFFGIIHNAGLLIPKPFEELHEQDWTQMWEVNVLGPALLTKVFTTMLRESLGDGQGKKHLVAISSMGGFQGSKKFPTLSAYSATKAAIASLAECWAEELGPMGVQSNALCLGAVQTDMLSEAFPGLTVDMQPEQMGHWIANFFSEQYTLFNGKVLPVAGHDPG